MAGLLNEPAVGDVLRAMQHVLGHEAELQVSRAANSHQYGFSLPDVLQQRIDALSCEGAVGASGQTLATAEKIVGFNLPRVTGEVRVSGTSAESSSNFGSLVADTPVGGRVRSPSLEKNLIFPYGVWTRHILVDTHGPCMLWDRRAILQIVLRVQPSSCSSYQGLEVYRMLEREEAKETKGGSA